MGLYYDKLRKRIIQDDRALDMIDRNRYERHEPIGPCTCTKCREKDSFFEKWDKAIKEMRFRK
jgi:hypothetical protein